MNNQKLENLIKEYKSAPKEFQVTNYWKSYEKSILDAVLSIDVDYLRSGKYPILASFGFSDVKYIHPEGASLLKKIFIHFLHNYIIKDRSILPYKINLTDIRETAYHHCELVGSICGAKPIKDIEVSTFGNPTDVFELNGKKYTMNFLAYYIRYCFAHKHISFKGDEIVVELGSGSGHQIELLKKLYPSLTILCFDLPAQIHLCETYLSEALGEDNIVGTNTTLQWTDLTEIKKGCVHFMGNWQLPLVKEKQFDVFWNAASFGEMEPSVVENYLRYIKGQAKWVYLLQAAAGKETSGKTHVKRQTSFADYNEFLSGYILKDEQQAWNAHKKNLGSNRTKYFEAIWEES